MCAVRRFRTRRSGRSSLLTVPRLSTRFSTRLGRHQGTFESISVGENISRKRRGGRVFLKRIFRRESRSRRSCLGRRRSRTLKDWSTVWYKNVAQRKKEEENRTHK